MSIKPLSLAGLLALVLLHSPLANAQAGDEPTTRQLVETELEDYRTRLEVTDYQWSQVRLILKSDIRERMAIAQRYGLDGQGNGLEELDSKQLKRLKRDMKNSRKATEERMERYLTKDQMKAFEAIHEQLHDELMAQLQERYG
jgi:hypothetical protein